MDINKNNIEDTLDFLLYSYFGITFEDNKENILNAAAQKAYNDASLRGALVFKNNEKAKDKDYADKYKSCEKERKLIRYAVKLEAVKIVIKNFRELNEKTEFDAWHNNLCDLLVKNVNEYYDNLLGENCNDLSQLEKGHQNYFTYGNAQKFVNMFLKNVYILTVVSSLYDNVKGAEEWYNANSWIIDYSKNFHIPLDGYILEYAKQKTVCTWSKIDKKGDYDTTRQAVKDIDFHSENQKWIEKAKEKRKIENESRQKEIESLYGIKQN